MVQTTVVQVQKQNRVTIPESIRLAENIQENDLLKIIIEKLPSGKPDKSVIL